MGRSTIDGADVFGAVQKDRPIWESATYTLTGTFTVPANSPPVLVLDPGGTTPRKVLMPLASSTKGQVVVIVNSADAAEDLTIKDSTDATTYGTISQNELAMLFCDGTAWRIGVGTTT